MKKYIIIQILFILVLSLGCGGFLDVNHDPNNPEESTMELVFPAAVENTSQVFGGYWLNLGEIWAQHWTSAPNAPQYQAEDSYNVTAGDYAYDVRGWEYIYTRALADYEWVKEQAALEENWQYYLMAEVMQCYTYQVLADFFDQIPLTNALQSVPATFDPGPSVYNTLIKRIDEALSKDLTSGENPEEADLVFNGNLDDWIAFANTLKLKIFLRQRFVRPAVADSGITALYSSGATFLSKDASFDHFTDESGRDNYMYALEFRGGNINMKASRTLISYFEDALDPRIDTLFEEGSGGHEGMLQGDFRNEYSNIDDKDDLSSPYVYPEQPVYFISEAESYFLQAEACLMGLGNADPRTFYELGVRTHFDRVFGTDTLADDFLITSDGTWQAWADDEQKLERIIFQKWVSMCNTQGMEAFFEHNRTGYPRESDVLPGDDNYPSAVDPGEFTVSVTSVLAPPVLFPKRLIFPSSEQSRNPNVPPIESVNVPVWWDRSNAN